MGKSILLFLAILLLKPVFSQNDEKSAIIGNPSVNESAANIVADNAGNTYVGGIQGNKGLLVKQNAVHITIWSKTLAFTTDPNDDVTIAFLDLLGDTIFGCGKIHQFNQPKGTFYFKMNAQTGTMYWSKYELTSNGYLSCMRYANGKYFLVGGSYGTVQGTHGKALAVSSQTGNLIWETPLLKYVMPITATSPATRTFFLNATEVKNGKFYLTGYAEGNSSASTSWLMMPLLVGISETGTVFMEKYLSLPFVAGTAEHFIGTQIRWDMDDNLVIACYEELGMAQLNDNIAVVKCDQAGNMLFSNFYNVGNAVQCTVDAMNETASAYVIFGSCALPSYDGVYTLKIDKNGNPLTSKGIHKPNAWYSSLGATSWTHLVGNSAFINNQHYFIMEETGDINQFIFDENLEFIDDCSELEDLSWLVTPITVPATQLIATTIPQNTVHQNGSILENIPLYAYCDHVSLNLVQNSGCEQSLLTANTAGFTDPVFYWSDGSVSTANTLTVNTTDTVIVRVLDSKCCELIDTIIPAVISSGLMMNLPADTTVCLQPGAGTSCTISPTVSNPSSPVQYLWSNNSTTSSLSVTTSGTYWVEVSDNCKTLRDSMVVQFLSIPVITNTNPLTVCEGSFPVNLDPVVPAGSAILWEDGSTAIPRSVSAPGSYSLDATNACGTVSATITVSQSGLPDILFASSIDTCLPNGASLVLSPVFTGATGILWSGGSTANQLAVSTSGIYTVSASNSCGTVSASCSVTVNRLPELDLPAVLDTCFEIGVGFAYTAQGSGGTYQWSSGSQTAMEWISQEGMYSCTLTNICGSTTDSMQVRRFTAVNLYFPEDSIRDCQRQMSVSRLQVETNYNLEIFSPGNQLVGASLAESGWYTLHAFNPCGEIWDSIYVNLQNEQFFYLPNSFTPNGDAYNERYEFQGENVEIRSIRIFNRWGEEIFTESGKFSGWDGTYKGESCPTGMYAVSLIYEDCFGIPTEFNGHVNLLR